MNTHNKRKITFIEFCTQYPEIVKMLLRKAGYETQYQADPAAKDHAYDRALQRVLGKGKYSSMKLTASEWTAILHRMVRRAATEWPGLQKNKAKIDRGINLQNVIVDRSTKGGIDAEDLLADLCKCLIADGQVDLVPLVDALREPAVWNTLLERIRQNESLRLAEVLATHLNWSIRKVQACVKRLRSYMERDR